MSPRTVSTRSRLRRHRIGSSYWYLIRAICDSGTATPLRVEIVRPGSRPRSSRSAGTARATTSMLSMPSRYCVTVKPVSSVCRVCATSCGREPDGAGAVLVDFEPDRLGLLAPVEMRIDQLAVGGHDLAHVFGDVADLQRIGPDDAELHRIADRRAEVEAIDAGAGAPAARPRPAPFPGATVTRSRASRSLVTMTICAKFGFGSTGLRPSQKRGAPCPT